MSNEELKFAYIVYHPANNKFSHYPLAFLDENLAKKYCSDWNMKHASMSLGFADILHKFHIVEILHD